LLTEAAVTKVQIAPSLWGVAGIAMLAAVAAGTELEPAGWSAGVVYLVVTTVLLAVGLARRSALRFGAANAVTSLRSVLVGLVTALVVDSFFRPAVVPLLVATTAVALALDGVDGWVARHTGSESELGARFDMEVDAFLMLVLCVFDARIVGWWVLAIGLMRYAFVAAAWVWPWLGRRLPPRYWRKVVTAFCGIALTFVATGLLPTALAVLCAGAALALLVESFGRDVIWLWVRREAAVTARS
jgi:phosphatidylglycerophosphate synthase